MRIRRGFLNWGVLLVCLGAVPLAVQLGALDRELAGGILRLWPLILIGIGLGLLLRFTPFDALGGVVVAGTFGLLFGGLFAGGISATIVCPDRADGGSAITRAGTFNVGPLPNSAAVSFDFSCADASINRSPADAPAADWNVSVNAGNRTPVINGTDGSLELRSADTTGFAPFSDRVRESWQVTLPDDVALSVNGTLNAAKSTLTLGSGWLDSVSLTYNASDSRLDLSGTTATGLLRLNATYNASSGKLQLADASLNGNMTLNASSLEMCVPPNVGLRITYEDTLSSHNFGAAGLTQSGKAWQSANYTTAAVRAELHISANISSTTLNPAGGCQ